jgi:UDP-N-acetyl-2-amino-2-deoxyglucuronate dehydrogenase
MLLWIFGDLKHQTVKVLEKDHASGFIQLERARVNWKLSIDAAHLPDEVKSKGKRTYRSLTLEGQEIEFSEGFTDLHTKSYQGILNGNGFGLADAKAAIQLAYDIRTSTPQ